MIPSESLGEIITASMQKAMRESLDLMAGNAITLALLVEQLAEAGACNADKLLSDLTAAAAQARSETTQICLRHTIAVIQSQLSRADSPGEP